MTYLLCVLIYFSVFLLFVSVPHVLYWMFMCATSSCGDLVTPVVKRDEGPGPRATPLWLGSIPDRSLSKASI